MLQRIKKAFSLVEVLVTLIILGVVTAAMAPVITKKLRSTAITVASDLKTKCDKFGAECVSCYPDRCEDCRKVCPVGQYTNTPICQCSNCADGFNHCVECTEEGCTKCEPGYYVTGGTCAPCAAGTYSTNGLSCSDCLAGSYCEGLTHIAPCAEGYYSEGGAAVCSLCTTNGQYPNALRNGCEACPAGNKCVGGIKEACPAGTYAPAGSSSCPFCEGGKWTDNPALACSSCPIYHWCNQGVKQVCDSGYYSNGGLAACKLCEIGSECQEGKISSCTAGSYSDVKGLNACIPCPAEHSCSGGSNKSPCTDGTYSAGNAASCSACSASPYSNCAKCNSTKCTECLDGYDPDTSDLKKCKSRNLAWSYSGTHNVVQDTTTQTIVRIQGNGTFTATSGSASVKIVAVGGGGAGGGNGACGPGAAGCAGEKKEGTHTIAGPGTYPVTVGTRGAGTTGSRNGDRYGGDGTASSFGTLVSAAGGGGAGGCTASCCSSWTSNWSWHGCSGGRGSQSGWSLEGSTYGTGGNGASYSSAWQWGSYNTGGNGVAGVIFLYIEKK